MRLLEHSEHIWRRILTSTHGWATAKGGGRVATARNRPVQIPPLLSGTHNQAHVLLPVRIYAGGATINSWYWDVAVGGERMLFNTGSTETGASRVTEVVNWRPAARTQADAR